MGPGDREGPGVPADGGGPGQPPRAAGAAPATLRLAAVVACFGLSGFAALLYQTAWLRQFSLVFGTSDLAVAAVLAAYMGGLALGAAIAGRRLGSVRRPVLVYGLLEAGIAASALAVPLLLHLASALYALALGGRPDPPDAATFGQPLFYLGVAFVVLAIPTTFMGATLPLLTRHAVRSDRELGPRIALLYAGNTAGAVLGTLTSGFVLLPQLGLSRTVAFGAGVNLLVFLVAVALERSAAAGETESATPCGDAPGAALPRFFAACVAPLLRRDAPAGERLRGALREQAAWILPLMLFSGAASFLYEVLWTRLLTHVLGGSVYAFTTMLATFLGGIAVGAGGAGRLARSRGEAARAFAFAQLAIAGLSAAVYAAMGPLVPESREMPALVAYAMAVMLPATVFIGATFPLAVRVLARDEGQAGAGAARVYTWNTVGAIAGSVLAGFWLLPALGFEGSVKLAVCLNGALALACLVFVTPPRRALTSAVAVGLLAALVLYHPGRPRAVVAQTDFLPGGLSAPRETFYAVGRASTVLMVDDGAFHWLLTNGLAEASIASKGSPPERDTQRWLTALAAAARPDLQSMLVVGFGGGVALGGVPASVRRVDVVELEPEVIEANRTLRGRRAYDPLGDTRVRVVLNDARNALRLTRRRYDAIVSQPSHPWTAGASHLFTREFARSARRHLNEGGVFVQWMGSEFVTLPLLRSLAATLLSEFRFARLYRPTSNSLLFLASDAPLDVELELARSGRPLRDEPLHFQRLGMSSIEDLVAALVTDEAGLAAFAADAPVITDDHNLMATRSRGGGAGLTPRDLTSAFAPHDPLLDRTSWIHRRLGDVLSFPHLARRLIRLGDLSRARALPEVTDDPAARALVRAELHTEAGELDRARRAAREALARSPDDPQARYLLFRLDLQQSPRRVSSPQALTGLEGSALAVARGWQLAGRREWQALAALDAELGRSRVTDLWYPDAALLRARWRTQATRDRARYAAEALALVDAAWLLSRDLKLPIERLRVADALGDADVLLESSRSVVSIFRTQLDAAGPGAEALRGPVRAVMQRNLTGIVDALDRPFPEEIRPRAESVHAAAEAALRRLGTP